MEKGLLFTYVMTYGGALVSLFNPFVGLLAYVCFAIVKPEALWYWSVPEGNYSRIIAVALLTGWVLQGCGRWQLGRAWGVVVCLVGYWGWSALSAMQAPEQAVAWVFVEELSKIVLPFLVGITTMDSLRKVKQLAWVILLSQGYVALEMNLAYLGGFNRIQEVGFANMDNNSVAIAMVACAGLGLFFGLTASGWWRKGLALAAAGLLAHAVLLTFSRGGMLALLVTAFAGFFLVPKQPKHYLAFGLALLIGYRLAGTEVTSRFLSSFAEEGQRDSSAESRLVLWGNCWDAMKQRPVFGAGPSHWGLIVEQFGWPKGKEAHTLWLQLGAELGLPGLAFLVLFYGSSISRLWPFIYKSRAVADPWVRDGARMVIAALVGFTVSAQFVSLSGLEIPFYINLVGAGLLKVSSAGAPVHAADDGRGEVPTTAYGGPAQPCYAPEG